MAKKSREDIMYEQAFGDIPDDQLGRIAYILGKKATNQKMNDDIQKTAKKIKRIKTHKVEFTMWKILKPSARPRANTRGGYVHMYVPRAAENGAWFENFARENNLPHINTPCKVTVDHYEKTPSSLNIKGKVLAELGLIRPVRRTGDIDNVLKALLDSAQHEMLSDDCLVYETHVNLYYSIKPHVHVVFDCLDKDPFDVLKEAK